MAFSTYIRLEWYIDYYGCCILSLYNQDLLYDPADADDFSTPLDDKGVSVLAAIQEDKRKK